MTYSLVFPNLLHIFFNSVSSESNASLFLQQEQPEQQEGASGCDLSSSYGLSHWDRQGVIFHIFMFTTYFSSFWKNLDVFPIFSLS